ncbi:hypothetical protein [Geminocystis sp. NIES-3709]|uniref:hypothetical protein n=1 Tax=Geminocystis sp. NIES-3709 TaxID=1617448 RepID=UPI0008240190|nr:hypothetical protein [Geminocystis sp. NIES-3709]
MIIVVFFALMNLYIQISKYHFDIRSEWMVVFNLDREMNFPTLYSVFLLIISAIILKQIFLLKKQLHDPFFKHWRNLYYIFIFLSLDEGLQLHEALILRSVGDRLIGIFHFVWVIPYTILVIISIFYFAKLLATLPTEIMRLFLFSGGLYIGAALGFEMLEGAWVRIAGGMQNLAYSLLATTEEILEMIAIIIFINTLLTYIIKYQGKSLKFLIEIR